jgi:hypothetical protein
MLASCSPVGGQPISVAPARDRTGPDPASGRSVRVHPAAVSGPNPRDDVHRVTPSTSEDSRRVALGTTGRCAAGAAQASAPLAMTPSPLQAPWEEPRSRGASRSPVEVRNEAVPAGIIRGFIPPRTTGRLSERRARISEPPPVPQSMPPSIFTGCELGRRAPFEGPSGNARGPTRDRRSPTGTSGFVMCAPCRSHGAARANHVWTMP